MKTRLIRLGALVSWLSLQVALGQSGIPQLNCKISIRLVLKTSAEVSMNCSASGPTSGNITLAAIHFSNQEFQALQFLKPNIELEPQPQPHLMRVVLPAEIRDWQIGYRIEGNTRRIPLFVPVGSWESKVSVEVALPGLRLAEESFPLLQEQEGFLRGEFSHLPGFIFLPLVDRSEPVKWLSIQDWIDLSVLLLILIASAYWLSLRRRVKAELEERPVSEPEDF